MFSGCPLSIIGSYPTLAKPGNNYLLLSLHFKIIAPNSLREAFPGYRLFISQVDRKKICSGEFCNTNILRQERPGIYSQNKTCLKYS
jgi:hypothetical protein